jgi:signal transduction histidine kinase/DNA-binding response OmpR family regulator
MPEINVYGDKRRVRQIMLNLVGNAIKFTQQGSVRVDVYDDHEDEIRVAVSDTGIGMKKEDLDVIFERFRQADGSAKRAYEGTGLGLAITKEMVEHQQGRIWVESELNKGTTIYFTLKKKPFGVDPDYKSSEPATITKDRISRQERLKNAPEKVDEVSAKAPKGKGETILVVDDEAINIETVTVALKNHNYNVVSAQDGFKGLKEMKNHKPAAVLLDIMMPGMDGFEFCKMAKDDDELKHIPIMLLTAKLTTADKIEGFNLGAEDYLLKPFNSEELVVRIQNIIRRARPKTSKDGQKGPVSKVYDLKQDEEKYKQEPRGNGEKILVIDDEPINIEVLESRLKFSNYQVISASDGMEGLQVAEEELPDLIILDLMMPKMTGYEFCKHIRANEKLKEVPLIMLTGKDTVTDKIYGYNLGADDYMTKPVNKVDLLMRVYALLRAKALQNQLKNFTQRLEDLFGIGSKIASILEVDHLYDIIVSSVQRILQADKSVLMLFNENSHLTVSAHKGVDQLNKDELQISAGEGLSGWVADKKEPLLIPSVKDDERFQNNEKEPFYRDAFLSVPFIDNDKVIGVLNIERQAKTFTKDDLQILLIFANQATIAIQNANLLEKEKHLTQRMVKAEVKAEYVDILQKKNDDLEEAYKQLKSAQKQLIQSEKMATIGILAGGVAHEINTPLGTILTNAQMLKADIDDDFQTKSLNLIERSTMHCQKIIQNLLNFSRKANDGWENGKLTKVMDDALLLINKDFERIGIEVEKEYGEIPEVNANLNEIEQVFANILMNAVHAIKSVYPEDSGGGKIKIAIGQKDGKVVVTIQDNGTGISEENQLKLFDPFFTTKNVGEGTGLGLSVCHNIIQKHNGSIEVDSLEGRGTTFNITIPIENQEGNEND